MAFDFKKEHKEFYMPKNKQEIVTIPKANYIAIRGKGDPNEKNGHISKRSVCYMLLHPIKKRALIQSNETVDFDY